MPLSTDLVTQQLITVDIIQYIQEVIKNTSTPSWVNTVPKNYGEASAGTIKADEWRILSTVYLPIAFITLWGFENGHCPGENNHNLQILNHTMALFQAVIIMCRDAMSVDCATRYRELIKHWIADLHRLHPETLKHKNRDNVHTALHLYDFAILFGAVMSWWCFPFEHLIGTLQDINTNDLVGGEKFYHCLCFYSYNNVGPLEQTIVRSFTRGANLRWWLNRDDCPEALRQFKLLFDKAFSRKPQKDEKYHSRRTEVAHITYNGINYSRATTHLGNSLVLYYPQASPTTSTAGSIEKIMVCGTVVQLSIRRQMQLPPGSYDPFLQYSSFPARLYSAEMDSGSLDIVPLTSVLSHVARYIFVNQAVILNLSRVRFFSDRR